MENQGDVKKDFNVIIGFFYVNVVMIVERMGIFYIIIDYKGFDWIDVNCVRNYVIWKIMLDLKFFFY